MPNRSETILKAFKGTSTMNNSSASQPRRIFTERASGAGDPDCPKCLGIGYIHQDLPVEHPDFGRLVICSCRIDEELEQERQRLLRRSNLSAFENMRFETFSVQGRFGLAEQQVNSLKAALNSAQHFAQERDGWLLLMGPYGCGKTHLASAIANYAVDQKIPTLFLTVPDLLDWMRAAYSNLEQTYEDRFEEIRNIDLLVLDDLGTQNATPWAQEKLYQLINHRYTNRLPTVITTNQSMNEIDGRISSRLHDPSLVSTIRIQAPDYRDPMTDTSSTPLSSLGLHNKQTFSTFSMRESEKIPTEGKQNLDRAYQIAWQYAQRPVGWLIINGDYGTGKTHLAAAIGNYCEAQGNSPMFVVVPDLLDHLRATFSPSSAIPYDQLFDQVRSSPLLILDDLGTQSATPWAREKLYQLLNHRYNAELPTIITTSSTMDEIDPRIRTRMLDQGLCQYLIITAPAFRNLGKPSAGRPAKK